MSQEEIIKLLGKKEEMRVEEIVEITKLNFSAVWKNLIRLLKEMEVERRKLTKEEVENLGKKFTGRSYTWRLINGSE